MTQTFNDMPLKATTQKVLAKRKFTHPTPIQSLALPLLLQGVDLIGQAQTGTGKTLAFGLPIVEDTRGRTLQTLVVVPTRELANQVCESLNEVADGTTFRAYPVFGGVGFGKQTEALKRGGITCLVACPGRLLDLLNQGLVSLDGLRHVVLDEADRMLDMGFIRDIDKIFRYVPKQRQTMLFSATMPKEIRQLSQKYLHHPEEVRAETGPTATELTDQFKIDIEGPDKYPYLLALMEVEKPKSSVIFTRTKHGAKRLAKKLLKAGHKAEALQGNMSQNARERTMAGFRDGTFDHLVATDVAARGLDVKGITHVVNYDVPTVDEDYVHRIGRTGRAGARGRAFIFIARDEQKTAKSIERVAGTPIVPFDVGELPIIAHDPDTLDHGPPGHRRGRGHPRGGPPKHGAGAKSQKPAGARHRGGGGRSGGRNTSSGGRGSSAGSRPSGGGTRHASGGGSGSSSSSSSGRPTSRF